jgi:predicted lipoprotein with Yx(FWY)xxD motif
LAIAAHTGGRTDKGQKERNMRLTTKLLLPALGASLLLAACGSSSSSTSTAAPAAAPASGGASAPVVQAASNATLGATVLVNAQGMTLYHLSAERNGKWICTSAACVQVWHPLAAQGGTAPKGSVGSLGTVKRPDGKLQVTYKGMPLYTFAQDQSAGEAKGQGIKDVGVWGAVKTSATVSSKPAPAPAPSSTSSGGGYTY